MKDKPEYEEDIMKFLKKLFIFGLVLYLLLILLLSGCGKKDEVSMQSNAITSAYIAQMDAGKTTPEQDKAFIRACGKVTYELDSAIRGSKKADETRQRALLITVLPPPEELLK